MCWRNLLVDVGAEADGVDAAGEILSVRLAGVVEGVKAGGDEVHSPLPDAGVGVTGMTGMAVYLLWQLALRICGNQIFIPNRHFLQHYYPTYIHSLSYT